MYLIGTPSVGTELHLAITKTNGTAITISVTNDNPAANLLQLVQQLTNQINTAPTLQGDDGLIAEDLRQGFLGIVHFNLTARSGGMVAAGIRVSLSFLNGQLAGSVSNLDLTANLNDLLPRNHLYVSSGTTNLSLSFALDTTTIPDGYHELTAVACEGTHVQSQTRWDLPIRIQNNSLTATMTLGAEAIALSLQTNLQINVSSSGSLVQRISLHSTGGLLEAVTNQSSANFSVSADALGPGLHPLYAIVEATNGVAFRTATKSVRIAP